jgi:hypothetical protein
MAKLEVSERSTILISWGALALLVGTIIGAAMWAQAIHSTAEANQEDIKTFKAIGIQLNENLSNIDSRLSSIEGYLKGMKDSKEE